MKRLLYKDEEYFYETLVDPLSTYATRFVFRIFKKKRRTLFGWRKYVKIGQIRGTLSKVTDYENIAKAIEDYLQKDQPILIKCSPEVEAIYK